MRVRQIVTAAVVASFVLAPIATQSQNGPFRVVLLGTGTPVPSTTRLGPSTLVEAGVEKLVFDVGRDVSSICSCRRRRESAG
jgi:ribonuclease Z